VTGAHVALVHDWIVDLGGAERVLCALREVFPEAPLFTLFQVPASARRLGFDADEVHTSFLQHLPGITRHYRRLLPLYPVAVERLDLTGYDLIVSSSHAVAKGVRRGSGQLHLCYCHTPMRYAWDLRDEYLHLGGLDRGLSKVAAYAVVDRLRRWDARTAGRVDRFVANSRAVADRIRRHYGREASVVHPPVDVDRFQPAKRKDEYFIFVSRLVPYKRADLAVRACTRLGLPLRVVGDGPGAGDLRRIAGPSVEFLGWQDDHAVAALMGEARALLFPANEDFGIVPVEAQAAGTPVIAYGAGGVLDSVLPADGTNWQEATGVFFPAQAEDAVVEALRWFLEHEDRFRPDVLRANAARFSKARFVGAIRAEVAALTRDRPSAG
jgi:glycosyltransferase involved in cell wall biosynthesis